MGKRALGSIRKYHSGNQCQDIGATRIMSDIWRKGYASGLADPKANPFDEAIEKKWVDTWLFYANTTRFASAMAGGGDYGVYADGRYHLNRRIAELSDWLHLTTTASMKGIKK